jgi:Glycosyl transferase family 2
MPSRPPATSIVVVAYEMARELPRTLRSLSVPYQRDVDADDYEIIVVDNGSPVPVRVDGLPGSPSDVKLHRLDPAPPSPARAANEGIALARGELIGLIVDGARMASPGLVGGAHRAARIGARSIVTAPAWHLGPALHVHAEAIGYDQHVEDDLLEAARWEDDGYELFSIATPAASSGRGLFGPMGESSSLFMPRALWSEVGGLDERFVLPGGGLVNHDLYRRACRLDDVQLVVVLGEGTFHQIHGGAATSSRVTTEQMRAEYETIRSEPHRPPPNEPCFVGQVPAQYRSYLVSSVALANARLPGGTGPSSTGHSAAVGR